MRRLVADVIGRGLSASEISEKDHLHAAAAWLARAQDAGTEPGFAGRYRLSSGWSSSYPETAGYIVPTLLALANETGQTHWEDRAARAIFFSAKNFRMAGGPPCVA